MVLSDSEFENLCSRQKPLHAATSAAPRNALVADEPPRITPIPTGPAIVLWFAPKVA
jgi:hypothetical protein